MESNLKAVLQAYAYTAAWIGLSSAVILINKTILDPGRPGAFPFPLALSATHMAFCSALSTLLVRSRTVEAPALPPRVYVRGVLPIGALFAATLAAGNAAYLHLSVSFIQMLKASMPLLVYLLAAAAGAERLERGALANLLLVVCGVAAASYGEMHFVLIGAALQALSLFSEAGRLVLVQLLLQGRGVKLNPITTMYHVAPVCLACLIPPLLFFEARPLAAAAAAGPLPLAPLLGSAAAAFALNCSVFLLIGKTSALTMNVAGVVKDWLLIAASVGLHGSVVTPLQCAGYAVAMAGVLYYNYAKIRRGQLTAAQGQPGSERGGVAASGGAPSKAAAQALFYYQQQLLAAGQQQAGALCGDHQAHHQQQQQPQALQQSYQQLLPQLPLLRQGRASSASSCAASAPSSPCSSACSSPQHSSSGGGGGGGALRAPLLGKGASRLQRMA